MLSKSIALEEVLLLMFIYCWFEIRIIFAV